jgi:hypothetical protein
MSLNEKHDADDVLDNKKNLAPNGEWNHAEDSPAANGGKDKDKDEDQETAVQQPDVETFSEDADETALQTKHQPRVGWWKRRWQHMKRHKIWYIIGGLVALGIAFALM